MKFLKVENIFPKAKQDEGGKNVLLITVNLLLLFSMFLYGINYILMKYFIMIKGSIYVFIILRTLLTIPLMIYMYTSKESEPNKKKLLHGANEKDGVGEQDGQIDLELSKIEEENENEKENESETKKKKNSRGDKNDGNNKKKKKKEKGSKDGKMDDNMDDNMDNSMDHKMQISDGSNNDTGTDEYSNNKHGKWANIINKFSNYFSKLLKNDEKLIPKVAYMPILILSVTGALRQVIVIIALQYTDSHNVAIIQPTIPIFTALMSYYMKIEKMNYITCLSIFLSFFGLAITAEVWNMGSFDFGFLLLLTVPVTKGLQVIYINIATRYVSNDIIQFSQMAVLFLITLPFGILGEMFINENYNVIGEIYNVTTNQFLCILYSTLGIIFLCWKIQIIALNYLTPVTVSLYQSFQPCFTFVLARLFLKETINYNKYIGTIFIVLSLLLYQYGCTKHPKV
ncbi:integral membrane protein, putative [Plasmodium knowlesi strain H]|uniref:Integral membrane protein, putative n=3 Tax=Plasmodium knowlesi TaxID=5850 RepID=A0A5K1V866_PLAKH|nr:drug/metabolite transporter DMT1, putative [Plasmodium knowlesi strain H]OTN63640.1 putative Integral membrane protein [Plasmodium knowlesi]CAA9990845.1 drug/metabolite transporter DMT1, putative [Plasmodium knowlesi strain H]SBO20951.1 integral membrane protein, putative [Plasmodium knowlesi strain H]SBO21443.1 integral membrane protein, putative [Plasmodium knowlesi strain H]VVS80319.1 drug/metabolite transporter DMT1, putative [Plasmodium knowlesi strain H]|eukprot:XP_002262133.1 integral membrane protein, putative [Plasmodium knowlesi strain H]